MKTAILFLACAIAVSVPAAAQNPYGPIQVAADPSGSCGYPQPLQYNYVNGKLWGCLNGTWTWLTSSGAPPTGAAGGVLGGSFPSPSFAAAAITPNGPNVLYEYEVGSVSLLATGATTIFTTPSNLGDFHAVGCSVQVTSITGSQPTGTMTYKIGTAANGDVDIVEAQSVAVTNGLNYATTTVTAHSAINCMFSGSTTSITGHGQASVAPSTAIRINITGAYATATTLVATVRVWGFFA